MDRTPGGEDSRVQFGRVIRDARTRRGWNQDELADAAGISRPTVNRWETAKTGTPDPENARRAFIALGLDPRRIPVILGYVTADEMHLPAQPARVFNEMTEEAIRILEDPAIPSAAKHEWVEFLKFRAQPAVARDYEGRRAVN